MSPIWSRLPIILSLILLASCGSSTPQKRTDEAGPIEMNAPLQTFSQDIQSTVNSLHLKPSEETLVPVTVRNTSNIPWASAGKYPLTVSYKWFEGSSLLPLEGERTVLPAVLKPNEALPVQVKVMAPSSGKNLILKITLVQEAVAWFMMSGAKPLEIPVTLQ